jgi:hypothetical protein
MFLSSSSLAPSSSDVVNAWYHDHCRPAVYKKYTNFITKGFVDQNPHMQWCPAPGCTNAVLCELSTGTFHQRARFHSCSAAKGS